MTVKNVTIVITFSDDVKIVRDGWHSCGNSGGSILNKHLGFFS
jgi:hypothetical protein